MRCPECQTELPETAKFCNECGSKIEIACPQCGFFNPPGSKFCLECGHDLRTASATALAKDLSFDERFAKIERYLPTGLAEKILLAYRSSSEVIRRLVNETKVKLHEGWMRRYLEEILLNIDDQHICEAQHWIEQAIEADERNGMRFHLGRDYALYAELFKRQGDGIKAKEQLGKAIDIYKECGADGWVTKAEEELAKLS